MASLEGTTVPPHEELRSIIVTGASSGIGAFCARALKADGWRVFATARKAKDLDALAADGIEAFYMDYREPRSIEAMFDSVMERTGGRLDALYNNGAHAQAGAVEDLSVEALREQFEANFFGWHDLTRRAVHVMRARGRGRIVHCSSILGLLPARYRGAYCASKYALEGLMTSLRLELGGSGIHVSMIEPGSVESKIHANGMMWFLRNIDYGRSPHRAGYRAQLEDMRSGGKRPDLKAEPAIVYAALRHALLSRRPRPHYVVTMPAKVGVLLRRILPASLLYRILARHA